MVALGRGLRLISEAEADADAVNALLCVALMLGTLELLGPKDAVKLEGSI